MNTKRNLLKTIAAATLATLAMGSAETASGESSNFSTPRPLPYWCLSERPPSAPPATDAALTHTGGPHSTSGAETSCTHSSYTRVHTSQA